MLTQAEVLAFLRRHKDLFAAQYSVSKIGIFGSFARNEQTEASDIDILIEMPTGTERIFEKRLALKEFLSAHFQKAVDVCHEKALNPIFRPLVMKDAIYV